MVGMILSYLTVTILCLYIGVTFRDFVWRPPELVSQGDIDLLQVEREIPIRIPRIGISVSYLNDNTEAGRQDAEQNNNPATTINIDDQKSSMLVGWSAAAAHTVFLSLQHTSLPYC